MASDCHEYAEALAICIEPLTEFGLALLL